MEKFYQIFVSSTFSDLEDERKKVSDTLAKAGMIPAGMELFPATSLKQLEFIKKVIDRCDYYVVIVGARYGSLDDDKSFTEKEYEYALSKGIPILAFIHKMPGKISADKTEKDPILIAKLEAFRERLKSGRIVYFWNDINDLCTNVLVAVTSEITLSPGIGWVRGDQAIDPKVLQELERLRIENQRVEKLLNEQNSEIIAFPDHLAGPNDYHEYEVVTRDLKTNEWITIKKHREPWKRIFLAIGNRLQQESNETDLTVILDQRDRDYCIASLRSRCCSIGADVCGAGGR